MSSAALWLVVVLLLGHHHHQQLLAGGGSAAAAVPAAPIAPAAPTDLLVEYRPSPVFGVDSPQPRFSWTLSSAERGVSASAYQIVVSVDTQTAWDSGKVVSNASNQVECGGVLKPDTRYEWKVRWWDSSSGSGSSSGGGGDGPSSYSALALLHTGLFARADWHGAIPIAISSAPKASNGTATANYSCTRAGACRMVSMQTIKGVNGCFYGTYNESQAHSISSIPACIAVCDADEACKQITWAPGHVDKCVMYQSITADFVATGNEVQGWVKLSGSFIAADAGAECPVQGYPASCTWFESFADSEKHFVSNCDTSPQACGVAQRSCWPAFNSQLPIAPVNASYMTGLPTGANFSCAMSNFHLAVGPAPPAPPPPVSGDNGPAEQLRKTFTVSGSVVRATAYVSGVGWVDAFINGHEVAPHDRLNPGRTLFDMRQDSTAHDVTALIKSNAENAVGLWLGTGWMSMRHDDVEPGANTVPRHQPAARLLLSIATSDGKIQYVTTDLSWKGSWDGPIRQNDIYGGEVYDARMEIGGWSNASFNDANWTAVRNADEFRDKPYKLSWAPMEPIRALELNAPLSITAITLGPPPHLCCPKEFPFGKPPNDMICYNDSTWVARGEGPCGSWCTHAPGTAPGCGDDRNFLCKNASCPGVQPAPHNTTTVHVFNFPQNAAGWSRLTVTDCPVNTTITMYFSEVLCGSQTSPIVTTRCPIGLPPGGGIAGTVDQRNMGAHPGSMDEGSKRNQYICKGGGGTETYEPRFTYVGHRYVQLHGFPGTPTAANLQQRVVHSDVEAAPAALAEQTLPRRLAGSIAFGDGQQVVVAPVADGPRCYQGEGCTAPRPSATAPAVLDQIAHNVRWGLIDNLHSVPEDCDQRNERWGWMADASVSAEGNFQHHWVPSLYSSWLTSMRDVQTEPGSNCVAAVGSAGDTNVVNGVPDCTGSVAEIVPGSTPSFLPGDPSWMFGFPLIFSYQHRYYGDERMATTLYPGLKAFANYLKRTADAGKAGLVTWYKYGDWLEPGRVPSLGIIGEMSSSFNYVQTLRITRDTATALGQTQDAALFAAAHLKGQRAFHVSYWNPSTETYGNGQQAAIIYALYLGAVPASNVATVFAQLLMHIRTVGSQQACNKPPCIDTGILATKWLMETLSLHGRTDVGLDLVFQTKYPSWGYMAAMNATTVWEHWEYINGAGMNSHNHPALASVGAWLFRWVGGLRLADGTLQAPDHEHYGKGWKKARFAPGCVTDVRLPSVAVRLTTMYGPIQAAWVKNASTLTMVLNLPPNTEGELVLPAPVNAGSSVVKESNTVVWQHGAFVAGASSGVHNGSSAADGIHMMVGSGSYTFVAML
jgi:hypothetical protein